jgi:hypothetical protein
MAAGAFREDGMTDTQPPRTGYATRLLTDLGFLVLLAFLIWAAYAPSLRHAPRADQWCFLVDTMDQHTFPDILQHSYSYNRTRRTRPGDTDLFRPVLFALLSAEKAVFDTNLVLPQALGLVLHGTIAYLLLLLLRRIAALGRGRAKASGDAGPPLFSAAGLLPYGVSLFFALNFAVQELVIWAHLHGYLLFLVFLLGSLLLLLRHVASPAGGSWKSPALWGAWALTVLSAFTYELGQLYAVLAALFAAVALPRPAGVARRMGFCLLFASVLPLYQGVNHLDAAAHEGQYQPDRLEAVIRSQLFTEHTVRYSKHFFLYTTVQPFFPSLARWSFSGGRLHFEEAVRKRGLSDAFGPLTVLSGLVVVLALALWLAGLWRLVRRGGGLSLLALLLALGLYGAYSAMTVLGRLNVRPGSTSLTSNSYYVYTALLFALVAGFAAWQAVGRGGRAAASQGALLFGLAVLSCFNAAQVRQVNVAVARDSTPFRQPIRAVHQFVTQHRAERDFSMAIDYASSDRIIPVYGIPVTDTMFKRWINTAAPKYVVTVRRGKAYARLNPEYQERRPPADRKLAPGGRAEATPPVRRRS